MQVWKPVDDLDNLSRVFSTKPLKFARIFLGPFTAGFSLILGEPSFPSVIKSSSNTTTTIERITSIIDKLKENITFTTILSIVNPTFRFDEFRLTSESIQHQRLCVQDVDSRSSSSSTSNWRGTCKNHFSSSLTCNLNLYSSAMKNNGLWYPIQASQ